MARNSRDNFDRMRAAAAAGGDDARAALIASLSDERPRVARAARRVLAAGAFALPRERLIELCATARHRHTRIQAVALLARGERGASMVSLLRAAAVGGPATAGCATGHLRRWLEAWAPLTPAQVHDLAWALYDAEERLPPDLVGRLRRYVDELRGVAPRGTPGRRGKRGRRSQAAPPRDPFLRGRVVRRAYELAPSLLGRLRGLAYR